MGASLAAAASINVCPHLGRNHASRVVLLVMCGVAQDQAARPVYFAGWRPLAQALGLAGSERSQHERVRKILAELVAARAIELVESPAPGRNAKYLLDVRHSRPALHLIQDPRTPGFDYPQAVDGGV